MTPLDSMLLARSVAIVGASERAGSVGDQVTRQLIDGGFSGPIYPVNPGYQEIHGLPCAPDLDGVGQPVDLAVLAVANAHLESSLTAAANAGARSAAIFASCHGEAADGTPLRTRLGEIAADAGMPICGGNGMGFLNVETQLRVCGFYQPPDLHPGGVTFLSHSGSLFSALLHNRRGIGFNLVVSTGLEINTTMGDYLRWSVERESTRVIALFLETIREPDRFQEALAAAAERDVPVVAVKVGSSERAREAVATHSEALAGDDAAYEALFEHHGVHRALTIDEMVDTLELMSSGRRATANGLATVHDSGGEKALLIDTAERVGVPLPALGPEAIRRVEAVLDPGLHASNPIDAWGTGRESEFVFAECLTAAADDPGIGAVAFCVDLTAEEGGVGGYAGVTLEVARRTEKPIAVLGNVATTIDPIQAGELRAGGVPVLEGTETGLRAFGHLLDHYRWRSRPSPGARSTSVFDPSPGIGGEAAALAVLAEYGIPVPELVQVGSLNEALEACRQIGYPVVLKTDAAIDHKTEVGGVITGLGSEAELEAAYRDLASRLGPEVIVAEMVEPGVEVGLGMVLDPQFGPLVVVSAGGVLIEVLHDRVALFPPFGTLRSIEALQSLSIWPLLEGNRGRRRANIDLLADIVARFSELAVDAAGTIGAIDVNPVIAGAESVVAVDALMKGV